jgi:hypothetical protein
MPEPCLRTMATVLAALGQNGLDDDVACIEALQWARYKDKDIVAYLGLARQLARHVRATTTPRSTRVRIKAHARD